MVKKNTVSPSDLSSKYCLTVNEAARYFGFGTDKIRQLTSSEDCKFVLWVGNKRLVKRKLFEDFLDSSYSI